MEKYLEKFPKIFYEFINFNWSQIHEALENMELVFTHNKMKFFKHTGFEDGTYKSSTWDLTEFALIDFGSLACKTCANLGFDLEIAYEISYLVSIMGRFYPLHVQDLIDSQKLSDDQVLTVIRKVRIYAYLQLCFPLETINAGSQMESISSFEFIDDIPF